MFESWAVLYAAIYRAKGKDYRAEAAWIVEKARAAAPCGSERPARLLDVACGTGEHLLHLKEASEVAEIDKSAAALSVAWAKLGSAVWPIEGDMIDLFRGRWGRSRLTGRARCLPSSSMPGGRGGG